MAIVLGKVPPTTTGGLSRRDAIKLIGASAGLASLAACSRTNDWDLIVVGGGNTGMPAAIFSALRGARVLIVEAAATLGGTLQLSSGQMSAAGTKLQAAKGIPDSAQSHYDDVMRISKGTANPDLLRLAVFNAAETFDWLMDNGFEAREEHPVTGTTHEPYSHARYAWGTRGGLSILDVLNEQLQPHIDANQVSVLTNTEATELLVGTNGEINGILAKDGQGVEKEFRAKQTVLTCGGYASNPEMFERYEGAKDYADVSYAYSQGAGITLALSVGGYVRGGEHHLPLFGAVLADDDYPSPMVGAVRPWPPERPPWEIYVNSRGERFMAEDIASHDAHEEGLLAQPEERCWVVFDHAILHTAPQLVRGSFSDPWTQEDVIAAFEKGTPMFYRGDTVTTLAEKAGIDPAGLQRTIDSYNQGQAVGEDAFGRQHMPSPISKPPYYAVQLQSWLLSAFAGVAVDDQLRVVRKDGTIVENLYAAGELLGAGQLMGRSYCGGMLVTPALTFGRLLGSEILSFS